MPFDFWTWYWAFVAFVFGAIVGSFLNVCIWRLPRGESLSHPPSHCPACGHRLGFLPDMVPLLSQLWYRSRCRYCGQRYSWRYFWVELLTAGMFVAVYFRYGVFGAAELHDGQRLGSVLAGMAFVAALVAIFFIDLEHYVIPDVTVLAALLAGVGKDLFLVATGAREAWVAVPGAEGVRLFLPASVLGALGAFWLMWQFAALMTALLGREAMGAGDSLLLGAMGAFLVPWPLILFAVLVAVFLGAPGGLLGLWLAQRAAPGPAGSTGPPVGAPEGEAAPEANLNAVETGRDAEPEAESAPRNGAADLLSGHRGALAEPGDAEDAIPSLPAASRWGRVCTVLGTWAGVAAVWGGLVLGSRALLPGVFFGVAAAVVAGGLLFVGIRAWTRGDREWLPAMEELFEEDPGPRFIPFGPYLVVGTFVAMLVGRPVVEWYAATQLGLDLSGLPWD